jgi:hypothetical protein
MNSMFSHIYRKILVGMMGLLLVWLALAGCGSGSGDQSTPTTALNAYCDALKQQDYQAAYKLLSQAQQKGINEAQFSANFSKATVNDCPVASSDDKAGTGTLDYTLSNGNEITVDYTLVQESGVWKIQTEKARQ